MNTSGLGSQVMAGRINQIFVWVQRVTDPTISAVVEFSSRRLELIEEWWLVPLNGPTWTAGQIKETDHQTLQEFAAALTSNDGENITRFERLKAAIAANSWRRTYRHNMAWRVSVREIAGLGEVLSIVYGTEANLQAFDAEQNKSLALNI